MQHDILIVGAGPTGLVLALWLTKMGTRVRIIDKVDRPGTTSRALAVQARTLELYRQLDLADDVVALGTRVDGVNFWALGEQEAHIPFGAIGEGLTPFPYVQILPQDEHELLLVERLQSLGIAVERQTELIEFTDDGARILARLRTPDGREVTCEASFIAGCDGAGSTVRHLIGAGFPGGTYPQAFYVADVEATGLAVNGEVNIAFDKADFILVFPMKAEGRVRLVGIVSDERVERADTMSFDDVSRAAIDTLQMEVHKVNWFSTYRVHHRVADRFRAGRAFLAGDAGHIHSPAGGQGMNTGIGDAINLAWKLHAVVQGKAPEALLASYEAERVAFARRLVLTTDRAFRLATADSRFADFIRTRLAARILPLVTRIGAVARFMFRTISQTAITYRGGPISEGKAGAVHGGDRLPWVLADGVDNHENLAAISWQVHVYGTSKADLRNWCEELGVPLRVFGWHHGHYSAGFARDAAYLLRPDTYVAVADPTGSAESFKRYISRHQLCIGAAAR